MIARVGAEAASPLAKTNYVDSYGNNWNLSVQPGLPVSEGVIKALKNEPFSVQISANSYDDLIRRIEAYERDVHTNVGAVGSVIGAGAVGYYAASKFAGKGSMVPLAAGVASAGAAMFFGLRQIAGMFWNTQVSRKGYEPKA